MPQEVRPPGSNWLRMMIKSILLGQILVLKASVKMAHAGQCCKQYIWLDGTIKIGGWDKAVRWFSLTCWSCRHNREYIVSNRSQLRKASGENFNAW